MSKAAAINGAGRMITWELSGEAPAPSTIVPGLYSVPIDADIGAYNDGTKLVVLDFVVAARDLRLGNRYGRPTFNAWAKNILKMTDIELYHELKYIISGAGKQTRQYLIDTQTVYDLATGEVAGRLVSPRQLLVTRHVLDICTDQDLETLVSSERSDIDMLKTQFEDDGWVAEEVSIEGLNIVTREFTALTKVIVVAGTVLIRAGIEGFLEHSSHTNSSMIFESGTVVEGFVPSEGVTMLICTMGEESADEPLRAS